MSTPLTPQQMALVRDSWLSVAAIAPRAAALFYANLFRAHPALEPMFKSDLGQQGRKLMHMIGTAVAHMDKPDALEPLLQELARRHLARGVEAAHYASVGTALLDTLAQGLGDRYDPALHAAWAALYTQLSETMIAAAYPATAARTDQPA
jgi:hemoglobin-like flavoprotein